MRKILKHSELLLWTGGLITLALIDPSGSHFSICLFHNLGIDFCPGCGLGRSIGYLFRGDFVASFNSHPLGALAILILLHRIYSLINQTITHESKITHASS